MNKNNSVHLTFFTITILLLTFVSVKQVVVNSDYTPLSYKSLLSPKNFVKAFSSIKNTKEYKVNLEEIKKIRKINSKTGYKHDQFINFSTGGETYYIASTNDYKTWDLLYIDNYSSEIIFKIKDIKHSGKQLVHSYKLKVNTHMPIFNKIAFPHQTDDGYMITLYDLENRKVIAEFPTIMSHGPDSKAQEISQFFYDETANLVGYKTGSEDNKFYTLDLNLTSPADSLMQMVYLETAGKNFEFLYYYPETQMMLFKGTKKVESNTNHPDEEYFLYSANKPALVILDESNFE